MTSEGIVTLGIAVGANVVALACYPFLNGSRGTRVAAVLLTSAALLVLPFLVPLTGPDAPFVRFLVAVISASLVCRVVDLHLGHRAHGRPPLREVAVFFLVPLTFVFRRIGVEPGPGTRGNVIRLVRGLLEAGLGVALLVVVFRADLWQTSRLLDHCAKWLAVYPLLDGGIVVLVAAVRLMGVRAIDVYRNPILASTPADFWRRYNRVVSEFLNHDVAQQVGGRRAPVRATLAAFFVSALIHEYLIVAALGYPTWHMTAFFMLHGVATALTLRVRPRGWRRVPAVALTLAFLLLSLVVFTAIMDQVIAFTLYPAGPPLPW